MYISFNFLFLRDKTFVSVISDNYYQKWQKIDSRKFTSILKTEKRKKAFTFLCEHSWSTKNIESSATTVNDFSPLTIVAELSILGYFRSKIESFATTVNDF